MKKPSRREAAVRRSIVRGFESVPVAKRQSVSSPAQYRILGECNPDILQYEELLWPCRTRPGRGSGGGPSPPVGVVSNDLLLETGDYLLLESGNRLVLEP